MTLKFGLALASAAALFAASAQAAPVTVMNGDIEAAASLPNSGYGSWGRGIVGFETSGFAGTWAPDASSPAYASIPAAVGTQFGFVSNGASVYQSLGITIESDFEYEFSGLFGHRADLSAFGGVIGFFAGDVTNVIASLDLADPGAGNWSVQSLFLDAVTAAASVGQELGIFLSVAAGGPAVQINFDNLSVDAALAAGLVDPPIQNPLPAGFILFGTGLAAVGAFRTRKRKTA